MNRKKNEKPSIGNNFCNFNAFPSDVCLLETKTKKSEKELFVWVSERDKQHR